MEAEAINNGCAQYGHRDDFNGYISMLLDPSTGSLNTTLMRQCKSTICTSLWGAGNPDISGIGMIVGHVVDHVLGLLLAMLLSYISAQTHPKLAPLLSSLLNKFHDCSAFLCFSIQTAAIVVLVKSDAGISTAGMGDGSIRITEAVSSLTLLPLAYAVVLLPRRNIEQGRIEQNSRSETHDEASEKRDSTKRFSLLVFCWLMAFYPFFSKMNSVYGPSEISNDAGAAITTTQFDLLAQTCFENVDPISNSEDNFMSAFAILSYIPISLFVLGRIIILAMKKHHEDSRLHQRLAELSKHKHERLMHYLVAGMLVAIPLLASGLLWTVLRVSRFQDQLARTLGNSDSDDQWTFGQVVAVTVFAPVLIEAWFLAQASWNAAPEGDANDQPEKSTASRQS